MQTSAAALEPRITRDEQIRTALTDPSIKSGAVQDALDAAEQERQRLIKAHRAAEAKALDPRSPAETARAAEAEMKDLAFTCARLETAVEQLTARRDEVQRSERQADTQSVQEAALVQRDALAERIRSEWPKAAQVLADLNAEIIASDAALKAAGLNELSAEFVARGILGNGHWPNEKGLGPAARLKQQPLPRFDRTGDAWSRDRGWA